MCDALRELMKPEIDQAVAQAVTQAREETTADFVQKLAKSFIKNGTVADMDEAIKMAEAILRD